MGSYWDLLSPELKESILQQKARLEYKDVMRQLHETLTPREYGAAYEEMCGCVPGLGWFWNWRDLEFGDFTTRFRTIYGVRKCNDCRTAGVRNCRCFVKLAAELPESY